MLNGNIRIGILGCGNMGSALARGIQSNFPEARFFLYTPTRVKAELLANEINGIVVEKLDEMPKDLDWYILGFKPQSLPEFSFRFSKDAKILSVLAGVNLTKLSSKFNLKKIARLMPNTPSSLGMGANLLYLDSQHFSEEESNDLLKLLESTGKIFLMGIESDLDKTTAFSGSGPALIFELARIFEAELIKMTDGKVPAKEIITQLFLGSAHLMNKNLASTSFEELRNQVTSKKGVTYEALQVLEKNQLQSTYASAFEAAYKRTLELSK